MFVCKTCNKQVCAVTERGAAGCILQTSVKSPTDFTCPSCLIRNRKPMPARHLGLLSAFFTERTCIFQYFVQAYASQTYTKDVKPLIVVCLTLFKPDLLWSYVSSMLTLEYIDCPTNVRRFLNSSWRLLNNFRSCAFRWYT